VVRGDLTGRAVDRCVISGLPAIYSILPKSPVHYVTYVKIYDATPEVVYRGYAPGYVGTVSADDVVYGTGWYYPPYLSDS
jgi:hypothetical protein